MRTNNELELIDVNTRINSIVDTCRLLLDDAQSIVCRLKNESDMHRVLVAKGLNEISSYIDAVNAVLDTV